jgi:hypothetical protein
MTMSFSRLRYLKLGNKYHLIIILQNINFNHQFQNKLLFKKESIEHRSLLEHRSLFEPNYWF